MQNHEQIRARNSLLFANAVKTGKDIASGKDGGQAIKKIPPMIMANGLMATLAFSVEKKVNNQTKREELTRGGYASIMGALARHLCDEHIEITQGTSDAESLLTYLSKSDSNTLKLATAEGLAWLGYARRFVTAPEE